LEEISHPRRGTNHSNPKARQVHGSLSFAVVAVAHAGIPTKQSGPSQTEEMTDEKQMAQGWTRRR